MTTTSAQQTHAEDNWHFLHDCFQLLSSFTHRAQQLSSCYTRPLQITSMLCNVMSSTTFSCKDRSETWETMWLTVTQQATHIDVHTTTCVDHMVHHARSKHTNVHTSRQALLGSSLSHVPVSEIHLHEILKLVMWPWPRAFQGRFVTDRLGHAMINLTTKFIVPNFTCYGNTKGVAKCRKWGGLGELGVTQAYRQCHHLIERIWLPIRL